MSAFVACHTSLFLSSCFPSISTLWNCAKRLTSLLIYCQMDIPKRKQRTGREDHSNLRQDNRNQPKSTPIVKKKKKKIFINLRETLRCTDCITMELEPGLDSSHWATGQRTAWQQIHIRTWTRRRKCLWRKLPTGGHDYTWSVSFSAVKHRAANIYKRALGHIWRPLNLKHRLTTTNHKIQPIFGLMGGKGQYY